MALKLPDRLASLGAAQHARYEWSGARDDLDDFIQSSEECVDDFPPGPHRAAYLHNLGIGLITRSEVDGALSDLRAAVGYLEEADALAGPGNPERAQYKSSLGDAELDLFQRGGGEGHLESAVQKSQEAVDVLSGLLVVQAVDNGPQVLAGYRFNLGVALAVRYEQQADPNDFEAALGHFQQALAAELAPQVCAMARSTLGRIYHLRYQRRGLRTDLDAAADAYQQALEDLPAGHADRGPYQDGRGRVLADRFELDGDATDWDDAVAAFEEAVAASGMTAAQRIDVARAYAKLVAPVDPGLAASLLTNAVLELVEVAPWFLERGDRQYSISRFTGLAADAAALTLDDPNVPEQERPAQALRLLETGRAVLLGQALRMRVDLSEPRDQQPELARQYDELRYWLSRPQLPPASDESPDTLRAAGRARRQKEDEYTALLANIRSLGFPDIGLLSPVERPEPQGEAVVVLNVSRYRSDAILVSADGIKNKLLPGLSEDAVYQQAERFHKALAAAAAPGLDQQAETRRREGETAITETLEWLWRSAAGPALDALSFRDEQTGGWEHWPRVWWVPGGALSLLPLHAAGYHGDRRPPGQGNVMERVVSSYTPTIAARAFARRPRPRSARHSLIVGMSATPGRPELPEAVDEVSEVEGYLRRLAPTVMTNPPSGGPLPTKVAVLELLPGCAVAHFACHAYTDLADPSQSGILLRSATEDAAELLTVAEIDPVDLEGAELAYLSACDTARVADPRLYDEAIHLSSAFQLAGFPHVIGTLWQISDDTSVEVARTFYRNLAEPGEALDTRRAAWALQQAIRAERDQDVTSPSLWASYIHVGA